MPCASRTPVAVLAAALASLAGCDHTPSPQIPARPSAPPRPLVVPGHLVGRALIDTEEYEVDGLLAPDGELRLHLYQERNDEITLSAQLVAQVTVPQGRVDGQGHVVGQRCSVPPQSRFCAAALPAEIDLLAISGDDPRSTGEITVTTPTGTETWWLRLGYWGGVPESHGHSLSILEGLYRETLADFAAADDVIVSGDSEGRLFFQSSATGCIGNGLLSQAFDGVNMYRAELTIASCRGDFAPLNTELVGLATLEFSTPWDLVEFGPKLWLSARDGSAVALTAIAQEL